MKKKYVYEYNKMCEICNLPFVTKRYSTKICSDKCVKEKLSRKRKYTQEQIDKAIEMKLSGASAKEIEKESGVARGAQHRFFTENNIKLTKEQEHALSQKRWVGHTPIVDGKKLCKCCNIMKSLEDFHKTVSRLTGVASRCKDCYIKFTYEPNKEEIKKRSKEWYWKNTEKSKTKSSEYYENNKQEAMDRAKVWAIKNPEKRQAIVNTYRLDNLPSFRARCANYRATKAQATPSWLSDDQKAEIKRIYQNCPSGHHVDHIVPLHGEDVCGLHVPWNLQYLTKYENEVKVNKTIEEIKVGICHQYQRKLDTMEEDKILGMPFGADLKDFTFQKEDYKIEHRSFIERYEWLGTMGYSSRWIFTARYKGILGGIVIISEPNSYIANKNLEALVSRGATASWTPKNLGSKLVSFACNETVKSTDKRVFFGYSDHSAGEIGTIYQACNFLYLGNSFGSKSTYELKNGKRVTGRFFRKTSTYKKYAKILGIEWQKEWTKPNKYMDIKKIPKNIMEQLVLMGKNEQLACTVHKESPKGKYVIFLGKDKKEKNSIKKTYDIVFGGYKNYPKRQSEIV